MGKVVADNLRGQRSLRRMSQDVVATRMGWFGHSWSRATVSEIEREERTVSLDEFLALALVLGIQPLRLLLPQRGKVDLGGNLNPVNQNFLELWLAGRIEVEANPEDEGESVLVTSVETEPGFRQSPTVEELREFFGTAVTFVEH